LKAGIDDLNDNILVGDANDDTVFGGIARQMLDSFFSTENQVLTICSWPVSRGASGHNLQMDEQAGIQRLAINQAYNQSFPPSFGGT